MNWLVQGHAQVILLAKNVAVDHNADVTVCADDDLACALELVDVAEGDEGAVHADMIRIKYGQRDALLSALVPMLDAGGPWPLLPQSPWRGPDLDANLRPCALHPVRAGTRRCAFIQPHALPHALCAAARPSESAFVSRIFYVARVRFGRWARRLTTFLQLSISHTPAAALLGDRPATWKTSGCALYTDGKFPASEHSI